MFLLLVVARLITRDADLPGDRRRIAAPAAFLAKSMVIVSASPQRIMVISIYDATFTFPRCDINVNSYQRGPAPTGKIPAGAADRLCQRHRAGAETQDVGTSHVPPDFHRGQHQDHGKQRQQDGVRHEAE